MTAGDTLKTYATAPFSVPAAMRGSDFEAETTINRKDFGLRWNAALETRGFWSATK